MMRLKSAALVAPLPSTADIPVVVQINDYEWWVGVGSVEQVLQSYMAERGEDREEATGGEKEFPRVLTSAELDQLTYWDAAGGVRTFREELAIQCAIGVNQPRFFAGVDI